LKEYRIVFKEEGEAMAKRLGCSFLEANAKADVDVHKAFATLVREINRCGTTNVSTKTHVNQLEAQRKSKKSWF
jgi:hypothetical protein